MITKQLPNLRDFVDLGPLAIIAILTQLEDLLTRYTGSEAMGMTIPPTQKTVGDVVDALGTITDQLYVYVVVPTHYYAGFEDILRR